MDSQQKIIRYGRTGAGAQHPFTLALRAALERKGLTLAEACDMAGLGVSAPSRWTRGRNGPFRESLDKLVNVLEAPELLDKISWRWRRWTLTCTKCGSVEQHEPGQFRSGRKRGFHPEAIIDEVAGTGTHTCIRCIQSEVGRRSPVGQTIAKVRKRGGRKALRENLPKLTPGQRRKYAAKARAARGPRSAEEWRWRIAVGHIRPRPVGKWGLCRDRDCGYVAFSKHRHLNEHGEFVYRPVLMHRGCQDEYRREHQEAFGQPPYPQRLEGQHLSPEKLADAFEMAVRYLLRGEPIIDSDKAVTDVEKRGIVPREFGLNSRRAVEKRIDSFIDQLPSDDRGGKRLSFWARALLEAKEKRSPRPRGL